MGIFNRLLKKNYTLLKILIITTVSAVIISIEIFNHFYFQKSVVNSIFDIITAFILTNFIVLLSFHIINIKQTQLNEQIDQLTEAYQYIGQINRKIDSLLEIDISALDQSRNLPQNKSFDLIFNQLINLVQAHAGYIYLKPPLNFRLIKSHTRHPELHKIFDNLVQLGSPHFKYSRHAESGEFFKSLNISDELLKRYHFVAKPVYMHNQDIGVMLLVFTNEQTLEERDLNIIRIFSFYLALNATFKPDFSTAKA